MIVKSIIVYLCDKQKDCKNSRSCGELCNHTMDPKHAKNGPIHSPGEAEGRFDEISVIESNCLFFVERERPHGMWTVDDDFMECNMCRAILPNALNKYGVPIYNYCPICGSDNRGV